MTQTQVCPFCIEAISADATNCPHCGQLIGAPTDASLRRSPIEVEQPVLDQGIDGFMAAYLSGAELRGAYLSGADLFDASLVSADLSGADLGDANLCNADLSLADLRGANLFGADLSDAHLVGTDLRDANLTGAELSGAVYDDSTLWPESFDPRSAGAIHTSQEK